MNPLTRSDGRGRAPQASINMSSARAAKSAKKNTDSPAALPPEVKRRGTALSEVQRTAILQASNPLATAPNHRRTAYKAVATR